METTKQNEVVNRLVAAGWRVDLNDGDVVYLSKRKNRFRSNYVQIDRDGDGYDRKRDEQ